MKVAFIRSIFTLGGVETVLYNTAEALKSEGFKFYAICINYTGYKGNYFLDNSDNIDIKVLSESGELQNEKNIIELSNFVNNEEIDLICYDYFIPNLVETIRKYTKAKVAYWYHNSTQTIGLKVISKGDYKTRQHSILKYTPFNFAIRYLSKKRQKRFFEESKSLLISSDFMFVLDETYRSELIKNIGSDKSDKIKILTNTIELVDEPNINKDNIIVYMGRFDYEQKRVERFVDIWKLIYKDLPDWRLELYGDGECFEDIKTQIKNSNLERIYLMGRTDNPNEVYDKAAIVALTSQYEGFPMTLVEAQNNGCVPIAFASVGGIKTIIKGGGEFGCRRLSNAIQYKRIC